MNLYKRSDIIKNLGITENEFEEKFLTPNTKHLIEFKLRQRSLHVIQESIRVAKFRYAANQNDIKYLSNLMRQSHESLNTLYECSHKNLNKLVKISDDFGVGARLTGAGFVTIIFLFYINKNNFNWIYFRWGGCVVALCDSINTCQAYIEELKSSYYNHLPQAKGRDLNNVVFATSPHSGAEIFLNKI